MVYGLESQWKNFCTRKKQKEKDIPQAGRKGRGADVYRSHAGAQERGEKIRGNRSFFK